MSNDRDPRRKVLVTVQTTPLTISDLIEWQLHNIYPILEKYEQNRAINGTELKYIRDKIILALNGRMERFIYWNRNTMARVVHKYVAEFVLKRRFKRMKI